MLGEYFRLALIAALGILLIAAAITDLRARIISNRLNLGVAALAPLWWIACGLPLWPGMAVQLLVGLLVFVLFAALFAFGMMGGGDVKLAGAMGTWLGPGYLFLSYFLLAVVAGAVVGVIAMVLRARGRRDYIPFGPMLAAAGIAVLLWGDRIGPWVLRRFTG